MSNTKLNATQAIARARSYKTWAVAYCLRFVANAFSNGTYGYGIPSAIAGWNATRNTRTDRNPPAGVPVYWESPYQPFGHVAISVGNSRVISTDWPKKGQVGEVSIAQIEAAWNLQWLGWGLDFCGETIQGVQLASVPVKPVDHSRDIVVGNVRPGRRNEDVRRFNALMWQWHGPLYRARMLRAWKSEPADMFGPVSQKVLQAAYATLARRDSNHFAAVSLPCWPGANIVRAFGGVPK